MICGASITNRHGLHRSCRLEDGHEGACVPQIGDDVVPRPRPPMVSDWSEASFLSHMLNLLEGSLPSPIGGPLFQPGEAIELCRSLIWQRLGRRSPF